MESALANTSTVTTVNSREEALAALLAPTSSSNGDSTPLATAAGSGASSSAGGVAAGGWDNATPGRNEHDWDDDAVVREFYAIIADLTGRPQELINPTGTITWHNTNTLWNPAPTTTAGGGSTTTHPHSAGDGDASGIMLLGYAGQYHDPETTWYYNHHRYYNPPHHHLHHPRPPRTSPSTQPHPIRHQPHTTNRPTRTRTVRPSRGTPPLRRSKCRRDVSRRKRRC